MGLTITGRTSWFGGPNDSMNVGTALGLPDTVRGIAVYNQQTLGGYWRVHWPNGRVSIERQVDIGPSPTGGRKIDFTSAAIQANGYTENNYPTDKQATIEYLGKNKPSGSAVAPKVVKQIPQAQAVQQSQVPFRDIFKNSVLQNTKAPGVNMAHFQQALKRVTGGQ